MFRCLGLREINKVDFILIMVSQVYIFFLSSQALFMQHDVQVPSSRNALGL